MCENLLLLLRCYFLKVVSIACILRCHWSPSLFSDRRPPLPTKMVPSFSVSSTRLVNSFHAKIIVDPCCAESILGNMKIYLHILTFLNTDGTDSWNPGGCFTNVLWALQNILSKFMYCRNRTSYENFKLKLCTCTQSHALGTFTQFQLEILAINVIFCIVYFREIILESSRNISESQPPGPSYLPQLTPRWLVSCPHNEPGPQHPGYRPSLPGISRCQHQKGQGHVTRIQAGRIFKEMVSYRHCSYKQLTHCGLVMPYGSWGLGQYWLR